MDLSRAVWTPHGRLQVAARGLTAPEVEAVLRAPERVVVVRPGRVVAQRRGERAGEVSLVGVFVDTDPDPPEIVTAYRTSKIAKYEGTS